MMSRIGLRLSGALPSSGWLLVTSILAGIAGSSSLASTGGIGPLDVQLRVGGGVCRWSLRRRYGLRAQFVCVGGAEVPPVFVLVVAGRFLAVPCAPPAEIVRVAAATVRRRVQLEQMRDAWA